jgi:CheY-like chemotaxis protein
VARVLVVEDDESIRDILAEALAEDGHGVTATGDAAAALRYLEGWRPDLIVLDLLLPDLDGWAFAEAYRRSPPPHAPILLCTAAAPAGDGTVFGRPLPEAAGVLEKPFDLAHLLAVVRRTVEQ